MLVHPERYVLRRVAAPPNVKRFAVEERGGPTFCCYDVP